MDNTVPDSLQAPCLMTHMQVLCKKIGPRPSTSWQERQAAKYVEKILRALGVTAIEEQPFKSQSSLGWLTIPPAVAAALAFPVAWLGGRWGRLAGGLLLLGGAETMRRNLAGQPPFYQRWIARGDSQNLVAHIPSQGEALHHVFLVGHLDTQKQRFLSPMPRAELTSPTVTSSILMSALGGIGLLAEALLDHKRPAWWHWLLAGMLAGALPIEWNDERQPPIEGANDNATAVSILLGLAEALQAHPLPHTQVTLLFTGCEEVVCVGMEAYLREFAPLHENTYWVDLEMVGTGDLCYVTRHGMSPLGEYHPSPEMVALARRTADKHPELRVTGKDMLILEEVATLRRRGYQAICLAGYDKQGFLPNWHRLSDTLENIEPDTLSRAARYTWALLHEIDTNSSGARNA